MTKKQNKIAITVGLIISILLIFGIFIMNRNHKLEVEKQFEIEQERLAEEERKAKELEEMRKKEIAEKKELETEAKREQFKKDAKGSTQEQRAQDTNANSGTGKVPAPETRKTTDKDGNKITVTKVPKINPNSVSDEVEKPSKKEPAPTTPPKENSNATVTKPPTSAKSEGTNNSTYPNTKPSNDNKDDNNNKNNNTGKTGNPFLDNVKGDSSKGANSSNSDDIGDPNKKPGQGDKF